MKSRSERYNDRPISKPNLSRTKKNAYLYDDMNKKIGLEVVDFDNDQKVDLTSILKEESKEPPKEFNIPSKTSETFEEENKVFDINSILEEAKKNRTEIDELEKKRKLKNEEYNVLNDLNKKYINNNKRGNEVDEEELQELINTITSNTLAQDIKEKELFSDLMATSTNLELEDTEEENTNKKTETEVKKTEDGKLVNSFYTKSMDLSEQDFDMSDEFIERKSKMKIFLIIFVILVILGIISVVIYFLLKWRNII